MASRTSRSRAPSAPKADALRRLERYAAALDRALAGAPATHADVLEAALAAPAAAAIGRLMSAFATDVHERGGRPSDQRHERSTLPSEALPPMP